MNTMKNTSREPNKTRVICPHCDEIVTVTETGEWICTECDETFTVSCIRKTQAAGNVRNKSNSRPVRQPTTDTCGWATSKWLPRSFGCNMPTDAQLKKELKVDKSEWTSRINSFLQKFGVEGIDWSGTLPNHLLSPLKRHGLKFIRPDFLDATIGFFKYENYMKNVFSQGGRFACVYYIG